MIAPYCQLISVLNHRWLGPVLAIGVIAATPMLAAAPVLAQSRDVQPLINTINRLERQLQALERTVYRGAPRPAGVSGPTSVTGGSPSPAAVSQLQLKSSQLEEQMRTLTGQIEELGFKMNQVSARLDRLVADVDFRLRALEGPNSQANAVPGRTAPAVRTPSGPPVPKRSATAASAASGSSGSLGKLTKSQIEAAGVKPQGTAAGGRAGAGSANAQAGSQQGAASTDAAAALPPGSPRDRYNYARGFLMRRDFAGAEQALRAFVDTYPENELSGAAQYWLGETYYVREDFGTAARTFADGFQRYPDSGKAPDNLLKLGMSLAALDRTEDACITLEKLAVEYPQSSASIKQRAQSERTRLKCK